MSYDERRVKLIKCLDNRNELLINICCVNYIDKVNRKVRIHSDFGIYNYMDAFKALQEKLPDNFVRTDRGEHYQYILSM